MSDPVDNPREQLRQTVQAQLGSSSGWAIVAAAIADAILAAGWVHGSQLEQVGWRGEFDDEFYDMRYERPEVTSRWEPVFRLAVGER